MVSVKTIRACFAATILIIVVSSSILWLQRPNVWSPETQITSGSGDSRLVDAAADNSGGLHFVWEDNRAGLQQVYYKRSLDSGLTWSQDVELSSLSDDTVDPLPRITFNANRILVFFSGRIGNGEQVFEITGTPTESNFSRQRQITDNPGYQTNLAVAVTGDTVHLVWQSYENASEHIYYMRSADDGTTWQTAIPLTQGTAQDRHPSIFAVNRNVFVVWDRFNDGLEALFFIASLDGGVTWQPDVQISEYAPPVLSIFPAIVSNGTYVHAVWNLGRVLYSRSADAGSTWTTPVALTNESRQYLSPRVSESGESLRVVTAAINPQGRTSSDVYYLESSNAGQSWTSPIAIASPPSGKFSLSPTVVIRNDDIFVAWEDNRNGHFAIFFVSKPNFSQLHTLQRQLSIDVAAALGLATAVYLILEGTWQRRMGVRARRIRRKRRKSRASRRLRR